MSDSNHILTSFRAYWITQFLGAFNDNVYKTAVTFYITYNILSKDVGHLVPLCSALFVLPFILFSMIAGNLADRYPKDTYIRVTKLTEIVVMLLVCVAFYFSSLKMMMAIIFLMGAQSAFFGPVKFSILPELVRWADHSGERQFNLEQANGSVEMGTFLAILLGNVAGCAVMKLEGSSLTLISLVFPALALLGFLASTRIKLLPGGLANLRASAIEHRSIWKVILSDKVQMLNFLLITWFWFLALIIMTILPARCRDYFGMSDNVLMLLNAITSIGIGLGAFISGSFSTTLYRPNIPTILRVVQAAALSLLASNNILVFGTGLLVASFLAGFDIVRLFTRMLHRVADNQRSQIVAASSVITSGAMFISAGLCALAKNHISLVLLSLAFGQAVFAIAGYKQERSSDRAYG